MLATALFSLLLAVTARGKVKDGSFTVIESRVLADGNTIHRIQEHAEELPELLSIPELESELAKEEEVLVPIDAEGNVLEGFKHLVKPHIVEISREQILRMNNSRAKDGLVIPAGQPAPQIVWSQNNTVILPNGQEEEKEMETVGADYDEAVVPDSRLPVPKDYENSKEKDPEVETGDDGLREEELEKIEMEIEKRKGAEEVVAQEVLEDISAITRDAGEELEEMKKEEAELQKDIHKAAEEILAVVSDDVIPKVKAVEDETLVEVKKEKIEESETKEEEQVRPVAGADEPKIVQKLEKENPSVFVEPPLFSDKKEEDKEEENTNTVKGAAEGAVELEGGNVESLEEEEPEPEPEHRTPCPPLRGEVIFRRGRPDSAPSKQTFFIVSTMLFNCFR